MNINELMHGIRELDLVLPEFQREFVWTRDQAKQLIVSLLRNYPAGSLLVWKTASPPDIKNNAVPKDRIATTSVILDGQQRLTTLYLLSQNAIPPYYREADILNDPRNLYFDLDSCDLQFYQAQRMQNSATWVPVTACFQEPLSINVFEIAQREADGNGASALELAQRYNEHLTRLRNVRVQDFPIQTVPTNAGIEDAIDVFDRVNSLGTKLSDAELALAHITGKWPHARREMKEKMDDLKAKRFAFDLTFFVRALVAVTEGRALFHTVHGTPEDRLKDGWKRLGKILDYLVSVLPTWAHIHSTDDLNTTNVLIPPIAFLACHGGSFASEREMRLFVRWLYAAGTWARYTSQTDQRLEHDVSIVVQNPSPWKLLVDAIIDQRGRIELKAADLEGRGAQHPLYRMTFVLAKLNGAVDWCNGAPLDSQHSQAYGLHSHHIFPQARLYKEGGYSVDNHLHKQQVNEIANRVFLTADSNQKISDTLPEDYLDEVAGAYAGALQKQFVPLNRDFWKLENFPAFLQARRELIARAYNQQMEQLLGDLPPAQPRSVTELIETGESASLELKSTLRWDARAQQVNKSLQKVIAKTVAGFMNSEGGTLLIGVADDGSVFGIENDMATLARKDRDGFEQALVQTLTGYLGTEFGSYFQVCFDKIDGKTVCRIDVERAPRPVFLHDGAGTEFYIRVGNSTHPLDHAAFDEYRGMHWET